MDLKEFRNALGSFGTGVTVVVCETESGTHGFTVNSFTSISMDPPLILVSVDRKTNAVEYLKNNSFSVNILRKKQQNVALHFAGKKQVELELEWDQGIYTPLIKDSLASFECSPWEEYDGGDHIMFLGKVNNFNHNEGEALAFYGGKFLKLSKDQDSEERYYEFHGVSF